jgi:hypothetical protein
MRLLSECQDSLDWGPTGARILSPRSWPRVPSDPWTLLRFRHTLVSIGEVVLLSHGVETSPWNSREIHLGQDSKLPQECLLPTGRAASEEVGTTLEPELGPVQPQCRMSSVSDFPVVSVQCSGQPIPCFGPAFPVRVGSASRPGRLGVKRRYRRRRFRVVYRASYSSCDPEHS